MFIAAAHYPRTVSR